MEIGFNNHEEFSNYQKLLMMTGLAKKIDENSVEATLLDSLWYISLTDLAKASEILKTGTFKKKKYYHKVVMTQKQFNDFTSVIGKLRKALNTYKIGKTFSYIITKNEFVTIARLLGIPEEYEFVWD